MLLIKIEWELPLGHAQRCVLPPFWVLPLIGAIKLEFQWSPLSKASSILAILSSSPILIGPGEARSLILPQTWLPTSTTQRGRQDSADGSWEKVWVDAKKLGPSMFYDKDDDFPKSWWAQRHSPENLGVDSHFQVEEIDVLWPRFTSQPCTARGLGFSYPTCCPRTQHQASTIHLSTHNVPGPGCTSLNKANISCLHDPYRLAGEAGIFQVITNVRTVTKGKDAWGCKGPSSAGENTK